MSDHRSRVIFGLVLAVLITQICLASILFNEHLIANYNNPWSAVAIDLDRDNDIDIVGSSRLGNRISWWENTGNCNFTLHDISYDSYYAMVVNAADMNNDSNVDIVCASQNNGVELWINQGNNNFVRQIIANWPYSSYLDIADVDSDGDIDVLDCCCEGGVYRMGWIENNTNLTFTPHIVADSWDHANSASAADIDSDGDIDLVGTASYAGEVAWFDNDGYENFTKHIIHTFGTNARPSCAALGDIDEDGDCDIVVTLCLINGLVWFENNGSEQFTMHDIDYNGLIRPHQVKIADLDNDGDQDLIATGIENHQIAWWEHTGNNPITWVKHTIASSFQGATGIDIKDIDRDGDLDVLGAAQFGNKISWWESFSSCIEENNNVTINNQRSIPTISYGQLSIPNNKEFRVYSINGQNIALQQMKSGIYFIEYNNHLIEKAIIIKR